MTRWRPGGFTMPELLVALFLSSVGLVGAFGVQVAANSVQRQARDINAATALGESFLSQLRGESIAYADSDTLAALRYDDTPLLWYAAKDVDDIGEWFAVPEYPQNAPETSPRFNALGFPDDDDDPRILTAPDGMRRYNLRYCIHYRITPVAMGIAPNELFRADVRVFWPITTDAFGAATGVPDCGFADPLAMVNDEIRRGQFRYVQMMTVLFRHSNTI